MRVLQQLAVLCVVGCLATIASAAQLRADHPVIGTWEWAIPQAGCTERMTMRADGTSSVRSGEELSDSDSRISDQPDADGFYTLIDTVTHTNGKPDCGGETTPIGDVATTFLKVTPERDKLMLCLARKGPCFGPYVRKRP